MTRRLLSACACAALAGVLSAPADGTAKPPDLPEDGPYTATPGWCSPVPLFRLRPTARRTMAGSLLLGIHPALGLLPTGNLLDAPGDHPRPRREDDVLSDVPREPERRLSEGWYDVQYDIVGRPIRVRVEEERNYEWAWWQWIISHWTARQQAPAPEQNEGYIHPVATSMDFVCRAVQEEPASEDETPAPTIEMLPMPHEDSDVTCPYLRQQRIDKHACQIADPEIGRDVLANLKSLKEADNLLEMAKDLASDGFLAEAMVCCDLAAKLCPGSPCAQRAVDTMQELARGIVPRTIETEESAEPQSDEPTGPCSQCDSFWRQLFEAMGLPLKNTFSSQNSPVSDRNFIEQDYKRPWDLDPNFDSFLFIKQQQRNQASPTASTPHDEMSEPGLEPMVCGLMKACHLLMSQGMQHQAAELARQAYALDPQRVMADPLMYKMHLLAESMTTPSAGASEESEPPTCPYCGKSGKPIREIVPEKKKKSEDGPTTLLVPSLPPINYEVVPVLDGVLTESATKEQPATGTEEASEDDSPASGQDLIEMLLDESPFEAGTDADGSLRLSCECTVGDNVYHLRYGHGALAVWKTTDASKSKDLRQIEYDRERIWFEELPSHLTPERAHGGVEP